MLPTRPVCCGSLFLSGFLVWKSSVHQKGNDMSVKHTSGLSATNEHGDSPFGIYRNALDFVMSNLSLDEDTATAVILNELGAYADDWQKLGVQSAAEEIKAARLPSLRTIDWRRAWLN
jgi:hypothetical protein